MKVLIAIDSFKGSLSSLEAGNAVSEGIKQVYPSAETLVFPLADGGEGTAQTIISSNNGTTKELTVCGPLGKRTRASYGIIKESNTAVIEMASAAGITLIDEKDRDPLYTTTYGVGELIKDAILNENCRDFIVGIGSSSTNDGGVGMLSALGFEFLDGNGKSISLGAAGLKDLREIRTEASLPELAQCSFKVACDVKNPLCGGNGCSAVYGPQKGATPESIIEMDTWLSSYADLTKAINKNSNKDHPGCGAAGGMGFAFLSYLNAELCSGIDTVIHAIRLEKHIENADVVITGEGRLDSQTAMGKAPIGIAKLAKKYRKTVIAFSGAVTDGAELCNSHGIDAFFPIIKRPCTKEEAMDLENAHKNLRDTAVQVFRLIKALSDLK